MGEYVFSELGYFTEKQCHAIKDVMQGETYMHFDIAWSNHAGNCTLIVRSNYETNPRKIQELFLHCVLGQILKLKNN